MNLLIMAGGNRERASSTRLCRYIQKVLEAEGVQAELFELYRKPVPFYSPDVEQYGDVHLEELKRLAMEADAFVLASPEYHGGMTGVLKNALDHLDGEHFDGKAVLSASSSGGAVGTSTLLQMQAVVRNLHGVNCPEWISIGGDNRRFNEEGEPDNPKMKQRIHKAVNALVKLARSLD